MEKTRPDPEQSESHEAREADQRLERRIGNCWSQNAVVWTRAIRNGEIESRKRVTDDAILEAITCYAPGSVLDLGCGEGWLCRELVSRGVCVTGVDAEPVLIERARAANVEKPASIGDATACSRGAEYHLISYGELGSASQLKPVDVIVCNFSLLGKTSTEALFRAAPALLRSGGVLLVQTLHPLNAGNELPYEDGWRKGSWKGFNEGFVNPAPWYFRTLQSWCKLFADAGFRLTGIREPLHPDSRLPASILFAATI